MSIKSISIASITTLALAFPTYYTSTIIFQLDQIGVYVAIIATFTGCLISAFWAAPRRARRGSARSASHSDSVDREAGNVKWFNANKGFGFITRDSGDDIFVHFRSIRGEGHRVLYEGQRVEFAVSEGDKGLQAEDVSAAR